MNALAPAMGKAAWPHRCLAPQLGPSRTSSERTFGQCVSPSPTATAATGPCTHRKSREVIIHLHWEEKASELGRTISGARHRRLGKRARLGAPRVGRVRMSTAATGSCIPRKSREATIHLQGRKNEGHACLARVLPGKPRELAIESLRIFQVRAMSNALVHRFLGMWNTGQEHAQCEQM